MFTAYTGKKHHLPYRESAGKRIRNKDEILALYPITFGRSWKILEKSLAYSLTLYESKNLQDNPKLAIFIYYVSFNVNVKEEILNFH